MHYNFVISVWGFLHTLKSSYYTTLTTFYIIAFLLHIRITILLLLRYIICSFVCLFFFFSFTLCIILLHPFGYLSPSLSISPCQFSLTLPLLFTRTTCFVSSSNHIISSYLCYFQFSPFQTTILDEGLSPKRLLFNFFSKFFHILHLNHKFCRLL